MKKMSYLAIGIALGIGLSASGEALAALAVSLIGKTVQSEMTVYVDNKPLSEKAPTLNGRAYLPVRKMAEVAGLELSVKKDRIDLKKPPEVKQPTPTPLPTPTLTPTPTPTPTPMPTPYPTPTPLPVNQPTPTPIPTGRDLTSEEKIKFLNELRSIEIDIATNQGQFDQILKQINTNSGTFNTYQWSYYQTYLGSLGEKLQELAARKAELDKALDMPTLPMGPYNPYSPYNPYNAPVPYNPY
jgi:hypothetical protein